MQRYYGIQVILRGCALLIMRMNLSQFSCFYGFTFYPLYGNLCVFISYYVHMQCKLSYRILDEIYCLNVNIFLHKIFGSRVKGFIILYSF